MRLARFRIANYRGFKAPATVQLRPLTLIFGYNSAGKSALMRVLPLLSDAARRDTVAPLDLTSHALRGGNMNGILSRFPPYDPVLPFGLDWEYNGELWSCDYRVRDLSEHGRHWQVLDHISVSRPGKSLIELEWEPDEGDRSHRYKVLVDGHSSGEFVESRPQGLSMSAVRTPHHPDLERTSRAFERLGLRVHWLDSLRIQPERATPLPAVEPKQMSSCGGEAGALLAFDKLRSGPLLRQVSAWFETATRHRLDVSIVPGPHGTDQFAVELLPSSGPEVRVPLADTGEGMGQVLPIVVLASMARAGRLGSDPILAIEHPELHLHPRAHESLADLLVATANARGAGSVVVETHSPSFLLRIQIAVARKDIPPSDVGIFWVRQADDGSSVVDHVTLDDRGVPLGWPPDVFAEDLRLARELLNIRRKLAEPIEP